MERTKVNSSHFAAVGYDPAARKMHIEFKNGSLYEYMGVPEVFYKTLMDAESPGRFFHQNFKPHFEGKKIS